MVLKAGGGMEFVKACFLDMVWKDGYMWFFDNRIQALCKMDTTDFKIEVISVYKGEKRFYVRKIFWFQNNFYFATGNSASVLIYDGENFFLQEPSFETDSEVYIAFKEDHCIYFFPLPMNERMVCFDLYTQKYSDMLLWDLSVKEKVGDLKPDIVYPCFYKGDIWFPIPKTAFYGRYCLAEKKMDLFQEADQGIHISGICFDGENIWLTQEESRDVICVGKKRIEISAGQPYTWLYNTDNYVIVSMRCGDKILLIDKETLKVSMIDLPLNEEEKQGNKHYDIVNCCESNDFVFLFQHKIGDLTVLYKKTLEIKRVKLQCENYAENCFWGRERYTEEYEDINLERLIQLSGREIDLTAGQENERDSGKTIWKHVRRGS